MYYLLHSEYTLSVENDGKKGEISISFHVHIFPSVFFLPHSHAINELSSCPQNALQPSMIQKPNIIFNATIRGRPFFVIKTPNIYITWNVGWKEWQQQQQKITLKHIKWKWKHLTSNRVFLNIHLFTFPSFSQPL